MNTSKGLVVLMLVVALTMSACAAGTNVTPPPAAASGAATTVPADAPTAAPAATLAPAATPTNAPVPTAVPTRAPTAAPTATPTKDTAAAVSAGYVITGVQVVFNGAKTQVAVMALPDVVGKFDTIKFGKTSHAPECGADKFCSYWFNLPLTNTVTAVELSNAGKAILSFGVSYDGTKLEIVPADKSVKGMSVYSLAPSDGATTVAISPTLPFSVTVLGPGKITYTCNVAVTFTPLGPEYAINNRLPAIVSGDFVAHGLTRDGFKYAPQGTWAGSVITAEVDDLPAGLHLFGVNFVTETVSAGVTTTRNLVGWINPASDYLVQTTQITPTGVITYINYHTYLTVTKGLSGTWTCGQKFLPKGTLVGENFLGKSYEALISGATVPTQTAQIATLPDRTASVWPFQAVASDHISFMFNSKAGQPATSMKINGVAYATSCGDDDWCSYWTSGLPAATTTYVVEVYSGGAQVALYQVTYTPGKGVTIQTGGY